MAKPGSTAAARTVAALGVDLTTSGGSATLPAADEEAVDAGSASKSTYLSIPADVKLAKKPVSAATEPTHPAEQVGGGESTPAAAKNKAPAGGNPPVPAHCPGSKAVPRQNAAPLVSNKAEISSTEVAETAVVSSGSERGDSKQDTADLQRPLWHTKKSWAPQHDADQPTIKPRLPRSGASLAYVGAPLPNSDGDVDPVTVTAWAGEVTRATVTRVVTLPRRRLLTALALTVVVLVVLVAVVTRSGTSTASATTMLDAESVVGTLSATEAPFVSVYRSRTAAAASARNLTDTVAAHAESGPVSSQALPDAGVKPGSGVATASATSGWGAAIPPMLALGSAADAVDVPWGSPVGSSNVAAPSSVQSPTDPSADASMASPTETSASEPITDQTVGTRDSTGGALPRGRHPHHAGRRQR